MNRFLLSLLVASLSFSLMSCASMGSQASCDYHEAIMACEEERREELFEAGYVGEEFVPKCEEVVPLCD